MRSAPSCSPRLPGFPDSHEPRIFGRFVRGLTLHRPWPWCFLHAGKRVENRRWPAPAFMYDEWIALHAGEHFDAEAAKRMQAGDFGQAARGVLDAGVVHPAGVIFAIARLGPVRRFDGGSFSAPDGVRPVEQDRWSFGPWVWDLHTLRPLPRPIPARGRQRLWRLTDAQCAAIERETGGAG